jgi:Domain of unknown function (DUF4169)
MADIVNLRQFRKQKARAEAGKAAHQSRALFGRSKADRARERAEKQAASTLLDGHRRDRKPTGEA